MFTRIATWLESRRKARKESLWPERQVKVLMSDRGVSSIFPGGDSQYIAWDKVSRILVKTNDRGPWGADVWWVLEGGGAKCEFPQGATGENDALVEIKRRFPSIEVNGMNLTSVAIFVCWEGRHAL